MVAEDAIVHTYPSVAAFFAILCEAMEIKNSKEGCLGNCERGKRLISINRKINTRSSRRSA